MAHGEPGLLGQDAALGLKRNQMRTSWQIQPMSSARGDFQTRLAPISSSVPQRS